MPRAASGYRGGQDAKDVRPPKDLPSASAPKSDDQKTSEA